MIVGIFCLYRQYFRGVTSDNSVRFSRVETVDSGRRRRLTDEPELAIAAGTDRVAARDVVTFHSHRYFPLLVSNRSVAPRPKPIVATS